jgi:hypothetical protein
MNAPVDKGLPGIDLLEATPEILRGLMCELTEDDALWKPAPDRSSVAGVLSHLARAEGHRYRARVDRILEEDRPMLEPPGDWAPDDAPDPELDFDHFEEQREANVEFLRSLEAGAGDRAGIDPAAGELTLAGVLNEWAAHDLDHIGEIVELVRARKFRPAMKP